MNTTTPGWGRISRLLSRVLLVVGGAVFATLVAWLLSSSNASADTVPLFEPTTSGDSRVDIAVPDLLADVSGPADRTGEAATEALSLVDFTEVLDGPRPDSMLPQLLVPSPMDLLKIHERHSAADSAVAVAETPGAQSLRGPKTVAAPDSAAPHASDRRTAEQGGQETGSLVSPAAPVDNRVAQPESPVLLDVTGRDRLNQPPAQECTQCPPGVAPVSSGGIGGHGGTVASSAEGSLPRLAFGERGRLELLSIGVPFPSDSSYVPDVSVRQPGVTPD